uniref:Uncharacterized protein LOC102802455 n=1 Tax=Saccoglossus kowalevskii TaxID=10224 RepID=A0ABM0LYY0_SACKO|nr:PREDICTED: uncharacterized protein LOC102802455 [Saccoglossus kowalevskii]
MSFWKRWSTEYLTALRERHQTTISGVRDNIIQVGDVVLVHNDIDKRVRWKLATVIKLVYGNDGLVRSAEIKTSSGMTNRPIHKLYPLEVKTPTPSDEESPPRDTEPLSLSHGGENRDDTTQQSDTDARHSRPKRRAATAARHFIQDRLKDL